MIVPDLLTNLATECSECIWLVMDQCMKDWQATLGSLRAKIAPAMSMALNPVRLAEGVGAFPDVCRMRVQNVVWARARSRHERCDPVRSLVR